MKKLLAVVPFALMASSAFAGTQYFMGGDIGVHDQDWETTSSAGGSTTSSSHDMANTSIFGIQAGAVVNDQHRLTAGYDFKDVEVKNLHGEPGVDHDVFANTVYAKYDYLFPVTEHVNLSVGPRIGYEWLSGASQPDELNGLVYGGQIGAEYRTGQWGFGVEGIYLIHDAELEVNYSDGGVAHTDTVSAGAERMLKVNVGYYF